MPKGLAMMTKAEGLAMAGVTLRAAAETRRAAGEDWVMAVSSACV